MTILDYPKSPEGGHVGIGRCQRELEPISGRSFATEVSPQSGWKARLI